MKIARRAGLALRGLQYRLSARVAPGARFEWGGEITNILGDRDAIRIGSNTVIAGQLLTFGHGGHIDVGQWCFVGPGSRIWSAESISIGDRVLISHGVNIHDNDAHPQDAAERHAQYTEIVTRGHPRTGGNVRSASVVIGDDAWLGFNSIVLKGVTIGPRAIVAAGSVVTEDVPAGCVVAGNPARVVRAAGEARP